MTTYRVVRDEEGLHGLRGDWGRLLAMSTNWNVFLTFEWLAIWWRHFGEGKELFVVVAKQDGETVGIAPLAITRCRLLTTLHFLGRPGSDYSDFIWSPEHSSSLAPLFEFIWSTCDADMVVLEGIREDSASFQHLASAFEQMARPVSYKADYPCPYLPIVQDWDTYSRKVRKKLIQDTGRQIRRLQEQGRLVFDRCLDGENAGALVEEMIAQKRARFWATGAKDIFSDGRLAAFYHEVAEEFLPRGWLDLSYLQLDETVLAVHFGFVYGNRLFYYMPSFRQEYAVYSPSRLLLSRQLEDAFADGLAEFDFLGGADSYKYDWTTEVRKTHSFVGSSERAYPKLVYGLYTKVLPRLKRARLTQAVLRRVRRR